MTLRLPLSFAFSLALFAGCNSYEITQTNHFADDNGAIVRVDYGRAEKDHVNTFVSPANGRELEFRSRLMVEVHLADGERFKAWQCMNFAGNGTMYRTDDGEWFFLASGFTCKVAQRDARFSSGYRDVYSGVLCNTPVKKPEKDARWKKVKSQPKKAETR